jgi:3',5'-cyclic AMP phosphodiesterase CpdA
LSGPADVPALEGNHQRWPAPGIASEVSEQLRDQAAEEAQQRF